MIYDCFGNKLDPKALEKYSSVIDELKSVLKKRFNNLN